MSKHNQEVIATIEGEIKGLQKGQKSRYPDCNPKRHSNEDLNKYTMASTYFQEAYIKAKEAGLLKNSHTITRRSASKFRRGLGVIFKSRNK